MDPDVCHSDVDQNQHLPLLDAYTGQQGVHTTSAGGHRYSRGVERCPRFTLDTAMNSGIGRLGPGAEGTEQVFLARSTKESNLRTSQ